MFLKLDNLPTKVQIWTTNKKDFEHQNIIHQSYFQQYLVYYLILQFCLTLVLSFFFILHQNIDSLLSPPKQKRRKNKTNFQ